MSSLIASVLWIGSDLLLILILLRAGKSKMFSAYPVFYGYLGFVLAVSLVRSVVALSLGISAPLYRDIYYLPTYLFPLLQIWILWGIYRRIIGYSKTSWRNFSNLIILVAVLTAPVAWGVFSLEGERLYHPYHALTLFLQMSICLLICREAVRAQEKIDLGQNLKGILSGLSLMIGCQAINFLGLLFNQSSSLVFRFFVPFIYFVALIVFTWALWDYAPIYRVDPSYQHRLRKASRELLESFRSAFVNRR
ncbi:MAG: hypothetical protein O6826_07015 [Acidobacteria bacterium]|nr:hypothetical protein [Acidobacteriota bacterium]